MTTEHPSENSAQNPAQQTPTEAVNSGSSQSAISQEEINKLVGKARTEGKATGINDFLKTLGVASADDLKALIDKSREREAAELSTTERAQKEIETEKKRVQTLAQELEAERSARRTAEIRHAVLGAATKLASPDPDLVLLHIRAAHDTDLKDLLTEDGTPDQKKLDALMEAVKKEKPLLFPAAEDASKSGGSKGNPGSPSNGKGKPADLDAKIKEQGRHALRGQIRSGF